MPRRIQYDQNEFSYHHLISRCVQGRFLMDGPEKEIFRRMLWQAAAFSGLEILTYCIMDNHFHILTRVPPRKTPVSDDELVRRYAVLYPKPTKYRTNSPEDLRKLLTKEGEQAEQMRAQLLRRMHNPSEFMRTLKLRYSLWYNNTHDSFGAFWSGRFLDVVIEDSAFAIQLVAGYIDLNPVRAGLVEDPKDYRFCGYAEAVAGQKGAKDGLCRLMSQHANTIEEAMALYRRFLFHRGLRPGKKSNTAAISEELGEQAFKMQKGHLSAFDLFKCQTEFLTKGLVLGSAAFVAKILALSQLNSKRVTETGANGLKASRRNRKKPT